jgi:hypothetical protein
MKDLPHIQHFEVYESLWGLGGTWRGAGGALSGEHMVVAGARVEQVDGVAHDQARPLQSCAADRHDQRLPHAHIVHLRMMATAVKVSTPVLLADKPPSSTEGMDQFSALETRRDGSSHYARN